MDVHIASASFVALLAIVTAATVAASIINRHRWLRRVGALSSLLLLVLTGAAGVNAYFAYLPTMAAVLGQRAVDQASARKIASVVRRHEAPKHGLVKIVSIPSPISGFHGRPAEVYLPPAWFTPNHPALPVIELLHGTPGAPEDWTRGASADLVTDEYAAAHNGLAPIVIMPDVNGSFTADTECVDGRAGRAETFLTQDVVSWAVTALGARADRNGWAIGGLSEGGYCALDMALRHPAQYATFLDFGGLDRPTHHNGLSALFTSPQQALDYTPRYLLRRRWGNRPPLAGWFEVGNTDGGTTVAVESMAALARRAGIDTNLTLLNNAHHTFRAWHTCYVDALPWLMPRLGLPAPPVERAPSAAV